VSEAAAVSAPAAPSALRRLLVHVSHYSLGNLLTTFAGLISFPLLTRIFSVADYGLMNLVAATITISVALGKLGVQQTVLRYHSEIAAGKRPYTLRQLSSTTVVGALAVATTVAVIVLGAAWLAPPALFTDPRVRVLLAITTVAIVAQVVESMLVNFVRAEQRTTVFVVYQVVKKWVGLGLIVFALLVVARDLRAFYGATALTEAVAVVALFAIAFRGPGRERPRLRDFSPPLFKEMVAFGIPMMVGYELSGIILSVGDRYVVAGLLGEEPLGLYSAAYNVCQYVQLVLVASVGQAIMPLCMQMFDQKGRDATAVFLNRSLRTYALLGAAVIAGFAAVGPELLRALASEKYAAAAGILPWVIAGMVVDGTGAMLGAGLFIHRRTWSIMAVVTSCAALNIGLNLLLIPRVGVVGAAISTLVSYSATSIALGAAGRHLLPVQVPWGTLARTGVAASLMYLAVVAIYPGHGLWSVAAQVPAGAVIYGGLMLLLDADARALARKLLVRSA
jgi:O-antigen/teichoic acid export membrane protein